MTTVDLEVRIHDRLRLARERAGLEQRDIANKAGVSPATVSGWEKGISQPRNLPKAVKIYAELTGYPEGWLWTGSVSTSGYKARPKTSRNVEHPRQPARKQSARRARADKPQARAAA